MEDYYNSPEISNSDIGLLKKSPFLFWLTKNKKIEKMDLAAFELGTLIHLAVLEPEKFVVAKINKPSGLMGKFLEYYIAAGCTAEGAQYAYEQSGFKMPLKTIMAKFTDPSNAKKQEYKDINKYIKFMQGAGDKLVLTKEHKNTIDKAFDSIQRNPKAMEYLIDKDPNKEYFNELSLFGVINCTNGDVKIKGKPDRIIIDHDEKTIKIIDLKSTSSSPYFEVTKINDSKNPCIDYIGTGFFGSFKGFDYYRQCAFYSQLVRQNFPELALHYKISNHIVPVNTTDSYACSVVNVTEKWTEQGYKEMMELLYAYNRHVESRDWKTNYYYETIQGEIIV